MLLLLADGTDWKTEVFKRLDVLGEKLGVAAGHLWYVLVRQGYAEAIASLVICVLLMLVIVMMLKMVIPAWKQGLAFSLEQGSDKIRYPKDWPPRILFPVILGTGISIISFVVLAVNAYAGVMYLVNPEYFALQKILEVFGK